MTIAMEALAESLLHIVLAHLAYVPTGRIPKPLETMLWAIVPLCPYVVGNICLHGLEILDLVVVHELEGGFLGPWGQLRHYHVPCVMEPVDVVPNHFETLKVVQVVQDLAAIARGIIAKHQGQEGPPSDNLSVVVHAGGHLSDFTADFAMTNPRKSSRDLAIKGYPAFPWGVQIRRIICGTPIDPRERGVVLATRGRDNGLDSVGAPGSPLGA
jgi:hypothetical protein